MHRVIIMPQSQTDRQTDGQADEHHGNSTTIIRSNERIAR